MVTSITFQFQYNRNYAMVPPRFKTFSDFTTEDLANSLNEDIALLQTVQETVAALNADPINANVEETITRIFKGNKPDVTAKTKTKRIYRIAGLIIHEEDKPGMQYDVLSPDGFSIHPADTYKTKPEAEETLNEWVKRYAAQGYYSSPKYGRIAVSNIKDYCSFRPVETTPEP